MKIFHSSSDFFFFSSVFFLVFLSYWVRNFGPCVESLPVEFQNSIFCVRKFILKENIFLRKFFFFNHLWTMSKKISFFGKNFSKEMKELLFKCLLDYFEEKIQVKLMFFQPFSDLGQSFRFFDKNFLGKIVKTSFYEATGTHWGKNVWKVSLYSHDFRTSRKTFGPSVKIFWQGCRNCSLSVHRNPVSNISFSSGEVSFVYFEWKNFSLLFYVSQRGRQKCLLPVRKNFLRQNIFILNICFVFSGHWAEKNPPVVESFPAKLSKLLSLCPWKHYGVKHFFETKCSFFSHFLTLRKKVVVFWQELFNWVERTASFCVSLIFLVGILEL